MLGMTRGAQSNSTFVNHSPGSQTVVQSNLWSFDGSASVDHLAGKSLSSTAATWSDPPSDWISEGKACQRAHTLSKGYSGRGLGQQSFSSLFHLRLVPSC